MSKCYAFTSKCHYNHLSYVIGVMLGDGHMYKQRGIHHITKKPSYTFAMELQTKDKSFAETFAERLDLVLHRPDARRWHVFRNTRGYWRTVARNKSFGDWWTTAPVDEVRKYILKHPSDFLEGFYDSEGNLTMHKNGWIKEIRMFTIDKTTCDLTCETIEALGLKSRWKISRPKGTKVSVPGKVVISNHDLFLISPSPYREFFKHVHSSITRKNPQLLQSPVL